MKRILLAIAFLSSLAQAQVMQQAIVATKAPSAVWAITNAQSGSAVASSGSPNLAATAFSNPLTNSSRIICLAFNINIGDTITCTDTAGNTYTDCGAGVAAFAISTKEGVALCTTNTSTTSSNVVTMHSTGTGAATVYPRIIAFEVTVNGAAPTIDVTTKAQNQTGGSAGSNNMPASITTATANSFVLCLYTATTDGVTVGTTVAFTDIAHLFALEAEYFLVAATGSFTCQASNTASSDNYAAQMISLKQ